MARSFHGSVPGATQPSFKFYYDFVTRSWKGLGSSNGSFSFNSYHQRLLAEFTPTPELQFQADVIGLSYFEVDYQVSPKVQLRWGRIWIPFDDLSPHSIFGGRVNTSEFHQPGESFFLPNIWADLGFGLKFTLVDSAAYTAVLHAYVVNGFGDGQSSPVPGEGTTVYYPDFAGRSGGTGDNNNQKAFGARYHQLLLNGLGTGISVYRDVYTPQNAPTSKGVMMVGVDGQLRLTSTNEIRVGYVIMKAGVAAKAGQADPAKDSFTRGGAYAEFGQRFGADNRWKFLFRAGTAQNDSRVIDVADKTLVGVTFLRNFGMVEAQLNYHRDLKKVPSKMAYDYGAFRLVTAF